MITFLQIAGGVIIAFLVVVAIFLVWVTDDLNEDKFTK